MPKRGGRGGAAPRGGRGATRGGRGGRGGRVAANGKGRFLYRHCGYAFYGKFLKVMNLNPRTECNSLIIPIDEATKNEVRAVQAEAAKRLKILTHLNGLQPVDVDDNYGIYLLSYDNQVQGFGENGQSLAAFAGECIKAAADGGSGLSFKYSHLSCYDDLKQNTVLLLEVELSPQIEKFLDSFYSSFLAKQGVAYPVNYAHTTLELVDRPEAFTSRIVKRLFLPVFQTSIVSDNEGFVIKAIQKMKLGKEGTGQMGASVITKAAQ